MIADVSQKVQNLDGRLICLRRELQRFDDQFHTLQAQLALYREEEANLARGHDEATQVSTLLMQYIGTSQVDFIVNCY